MVGKVGLGTEFHRDGVEIASVDNISGPNLSLDMEEITNLSSEDGWEEFVGAVLRSGEITLALNFMPDESGHTNLIDDMTSKETETYAIVFVDDDGLSELEWEFEALVSNFVPTTGTGKITANVTFKPTGVPDFDAGT